MRVGIVYDRFGDTPPPEGAPPDWDAEFEPEETIAAIEAALVLLGHEPVRLGSARHVLDRLARGPLGVEAAVNIAESYGTRNREAHAPILLELAGVPCVGSDALALSVSLDKHLTKTLARAAGIATPDWALARDGRPPGDAPPFPVFVKPRYEGTAKGLAPSSRCDTPEALAAEVARQHTLYRQDLLVETFVAGAEFTVGVVGEPPRALPALQRATERETGIGLHALERHEDAERPFAYDVVAAFTPELEDRLAADALAIHRALDCLDFSRSDFRVDEAGTAWFLEINPLPTFAPDGTFAILAELVGQPYPDFLAEVLATAIYRAKNR